MFVLPSVEALHSCASLCCSTQEDAINLLVFLAPHLWQHVTLAVKTSTGLIQQAVCYTV